MSNKRKLCTAERTAKRQTPRLTEYTRAEDNCFEPRRCSTSGLSSYCWQYKLSLSKPRRHIGGAAVYTHSFLHSTLHAEGWSTSLPGRLPMVPTGKAPGLIWKFRIRKKSRGPYRVSKAGESIIPLNNLWQLHPLSHMIIQD
jgi:hypothetical protein